jgi:hypothetical protein
VTDSSEDVINKLALMSYNEVVQARILHSPTKIPSKRDIGLLLSKSSNNLSSTEKYKWLTDNWKPDITYKFPITIEYGKPRSFQFHWFLNINWKSWLYYSEELKGVLCKLCVLFGRETSVGQNSNKMKLLYTQVIIQWTNAPKLFEKHSVSEIHKASIIYADSFRQIMENNDTDIKSKIDTALDKQRSLNRQIIASVLKVVILCGFCVSYLIFGIHL